MLIKNIIYFYKKLKNKIFITMNEDENYWELSSDIIGWAYFTVWSYSFWP